MVTAADREAEVARRWELLSPFLDERQRRLWMGAEAREGGHGGVSLVARAAGVARSTVTRGLFELESGQEPPGRARRPGGGRKRADVTDAELAGALRALVEPDARGIRNPRCSGLPSRCVPSPMSSPGPGTRSPRRPWAGC